MADAGKLDALAPTVKVSVTDAELKTAVGLAADLDTSTSLKGQWLTTRELTSASEQLDAIGTMGANDLADHITRTAQGWLRNRSILWCRGTMKWRPTPSIKPDGRIIPALKILLYLMKRGGKRPKS